MTIRLAVIVLLMKSLAGCNPPNASDRLRIYLMQDLNISLQELPTIVVVMTEDGCPTCNRAFAEQIIPRIGTERALFIIRTEGRMMNMNELPKESELVRFDDHSSFKELGLFEESGFIVLKNGSIDTVVPLKIADLKSQMELALGVLDSLDRIVIR